MNEKYLNGVLYTDYKENEADKSTKPDFEIATLDDGTYYVACANCHKVKHLLHDPFNLIPVGGYPLINCPHCGMNLFDRSIEKVRIRIKKNGWSKEKVGKLGFDYDLIMDEHRDRTLNIIKGLRQ